MIELSKVMKAGLAIAAVVFSGSIFADSKQGEPLQLAQLTDGFDAQAAYMRTCFACHNSGAGGAPNPNKPEEWTARLEKGMDAVMNNVMNGVNAMPAKGLCFDCTPEDLRAVVDYMVSIAQSQ
ncbi:MAG: c-type cytochrome [Gammaproteobacteria bacterium]|nr:cytochrome c5 family protein [Pseudomonadales bacterium]MCP5347823.1 cytochrome c5 family protein [Pseudomonadales bacterium]